MTMGRGLCAAACLLLSTQGWAALRVVHVGPSNASMSFVDDSSGTSTTTVNAGDTVQWNWEGDQHTVTRLDAPGAFNSFTYDTGHSFSHVFNTPGTFDYVCLTHEDMGMVGTVVVQAVGASTTTTSTTTLVGGSTTSTTLPPGVAEKFSAATTALATFAADLGVTVTGKQKKAFDKLLAKITFDLEAGESLVASSQGKKAKIALRRVVRSLITMRFRLGSKTGRKAVTDGTARARLIAEAKDLKAKVQAALQAS
jgi:plastocyanin